MARRSRGPGVQPNRPRETHTPNRPGGSRNIAITPSRFLCSARASAGQVELKGDLDELEELYEATCAEANHVELGKHQERLEAALEVFRAALQPDLSTDREAAEKAAVAAATHGLRLTDEERDSLRLLYRSSWELLAGVGKDRPDRIGRLLRETGETLVLERKVREILGVQDVRYRELRHFLGRISDFLERVEESGHRAPSGGLQVCRSLLRGIGEMAGRLGSTSDGLRPLLEDLLDLWRADDCGASHFVPDLLAKLELGSRERNWLRKRIDERLAGGAGAGTEELNALAERLRRITDLAGREVGAAPAEDSSIPSSGSSIDTSKGAGISRPYRLPIVPATS